jgi:hypothetical protein
MAIGIAIQSRGSATKITLMHPTFPPLQHLSHFETKYVPYCTSNNTTVFEFNISPQLTGAMSLTKGGKLTIYIDCGTLHHPFQPLPSQQH